MGFRSGAYATVFSVKKGNGNYYDVNLSTSHKDRQSGNYVRDFNGFVRFVGEAAKAIAKFDGRNSKDNGNKPVTRVKLGDVDARNTYDATKKVTYYNFTVFTFEDANDNGGSNNKKSSNKTANDFVNNVPSGDDDLFT